MAIGPTGAIVPTPDSKLWPCRPNRSSRPPTSVRPRRMTPAATPRCWRSPAMPLKLIKPVPGPEATAAAQPTWGVTAVGAVASPFTGTGVKVAILDTGIDAAHPAFQGVNLVQQDFSGSGNGDGNGHGTHCAGTVFGRDVGGTRIGVARGVTEALIGKVLGNNGSGSSEMLFDALNWASSNNAKVISMSLGFDFPRLVDRLVNEQNVPVILATSIALEAYRANLRVFDQLTGMMRALTDFNGGVVVVAASGNESERQSTRTSRSAPRCGPPPTGSSRWARCARIRPGSGSPTSRTPTRWSALPASASCRPRSARAEVAERHQHGHASRRRCRRAVVGGAGLGRHSPDQPRSRGADDRVGDPHAVRARHRPGRPRPGLARRLRRRSPELVGAQVYLPGRSALSASIVPRRDSSRASAAQASAQAPPAAQPASTSVGQWTPR